ncbi:MAG: diguanylate cyclase with and sensor [Myxococcaceae bacterium]|nr:diguanylate cyclase with and sensor [Myxococcaceae bacterium]
MPYRGTPFERLQAVIAAQRDIMACGLELQRVMDVTTERASTLSSAAAAVLELREEDSMVYRSVSGTAKGSLGLRIPVEGSLSGRCVVEGKILSCLDAELDSRVNREACRRVGIRSMLCVPLRHEGQTVGALKVYSPEVGFFDDEDISTLELMVGFISAATSNAVVQRALAATEQRFRTITELATDGIITADAFGRITLWNQGATRLFGHQESEVLGRPIAMLMPERYVLDHDHAFVGFDETRMLKAVGRTTELTALRKDGSEFPVELSTSTWFEDGTRYFTTFVRDISERKRLEAAILTLASTDHLTGLLNRRAGEDKLQRELVRSRRYERELSCVLLDIDFFKRINDTYGHATGDHVLRNMARLLSERIRGSDAAARWGGEEFLLVLPETGLTGAYELAEALRKLVASTSFDLPIGVTISLGVAQVGPDETPEHVVARADELLYAAKRNGRNQVGR